MKKLINVLKELPGSELVYVGTKHGSNWILIEPAEKVIANLDKIDEILHKRCLEGFNRSVLLTETMPYRIVELLDQIKDTKNKTEKEEEELRKKLLNAESMYTNNINTRGKYKKHLDTWIKVKDRMVIKMYPKETDDVGTCILMSGFENGNLWYKGEKPSII